MRSPRPRPRPDATSTMGRIATLWAISMSATICTESDEVGINLSDVVRSFRDFHPWTEPIPLSVSPDNLMAESMRSRRRAASSVARPFGGVGVAGVDVSVPHGTHARTRCRGAHAVRDCAYAVALA